MKNYIETFNNLEWHDAVFLNLVIDRSDPEKEDSVTIDILWPDETFSTIIFEDCFMFEAQIVLYITSPECIYDADCLKEHHKISDIQNVLKKIGPTIDDLLYFTLKNRGGGSLIEVCAKSFRIVPIKDESKYDISKFY